MSLAVTLADANILISRTLRDYFLYAASAGAFQIHWSSSILDETSRNLITNYGFSAEDAAYLVGVLGEFVPDALIDTRRRDHEAAADVEMSQSDRHVLAAALSAKADILLTDNTRHFPKSWMASRASSSWTLPPCWAGWRSSYPRSCAGRIG